MAPHKCNNEDKIGRIMIIQKILLGLIAIFLTLVLLSASKADKAIEKAAEAIEKASEIQVIKNDVVWIKKHLERNEVKK